MRQALIPTFFFPTSTLVIGGEDCMAQYQAELGKTKLFFSSSDPALQMLNTRCVSSSRLAHACFSEYNEYSGYPLQNHMVAIDITDLYRNLFNLERYQEITVVIADLGLVELDFFDQLQNPHVKKIAIGRAQQQGQLIAACCQGQIDLCLIQPEPWQIQQAVSAMQLKYFQQQSHVLSTMLTHGSALCLADDKFSQFFYQLCLENNIVEYYLIENTGSFLLQDAKGILKTLMVKSQADLCLHYELAEDAGASRSVLDQLAKGQGLLAWRPNIDSEFNLDSDWCANLHPASCIVGKTNYYYSLIDLPMHTFLPTAKPQWVHEDREQKPKVA